MTIPLTIMIIIGLLLVIIASALALMRDVNQREVLSRRISIAIDTGGAPQLRQRANGAALADKISAIGLAVVNRGMLSKKTVNELQHMLESAGMRSRSAFGMFLGTKILLTLILPLITLAIGFALGKRPIYVLVAAAVSLIIGMLAPEMILQRIRQRYLRKVEGGAADGLDMLVICVDSGLGLQSALQRVADEMRTLHAEFSQELLLTVRELQIGATVETALTNLRDRTGIEAFKRLCGTLIQALSYGTPLTAALRNLSAELRQLALVRFEEKAASLPVKLTVPMILFILPSLFAVIAGPAAHNVMNDLKHFGGH
jgi:tight adherence protein C